MGKRLSRWFWFNFMFALAPLTIMIIARLLAGKLSFQHVASSSEVLFFTIMMSATSMGDAVQFRKLQEKETLFTNIWCGLLFIVFFSASFYGCLLMDTILDLKLEAFRSKLLYFSIGLALASLTLSTATQTLIGKIESTE